MSTTREEKPKLCCKCHEKPRAPGQSYCRECTRAYQQEYWKKLPPGTRAKRLRLYRENMSPWMKQRLARLAHERYARIMADPEKAAAFKARRKEYNAHYQAIYRARKQEEKKAKQGG